MVENMDLLNRSLWLLLEPEVQQPPEFSSGCRNRTLKFTIYETFTDCHSKSMINMDAYKAVVHDFEDAYELVGHKSQESRASRDCISFSPTGGRSHLMKFRGRSLDTDVELTSMETLDSPKQTLTHARSEQLQSTVNESTHAGSLGRVPTLAAMGSTVFADAAHAPLLQSSGVPLQDGLAHAASADAGRSPLM